MGLTEKIRRLKKTKWLVVFVDLHDKTDFLNYANRLGDKLGKSPDNIVPWVVSDSTKEKLKDIDRKISKEAEITNALYETLLNDIKDKKKEEQANCVAVMLKRVDFCNDRVFEMVVKSRFFDNETYYAICVRREFLDFDRKLKCLERPCANCENFSRENEEAGGCVHSCLARLLWLVFNKDNRTKKYLEEIAADKF